MSSSVQITVGGSIRFTARFEDMLAPKTVAAFRRLMPYKQKLVHCRWSGEGCWIPLGEFKLDVGYENHTSHPAPGEILWYPGGYSETELIFAYGDVMFSSKLGQLAGNHFLTVTGGADQLAAMGRKVLYEGAQDIEFRDG
ncbi:MAG TPA: DUF3830 family protein [Gemmatimonadaceae bacterium]|nr:DUF3830 family protein [Gemmatimonadaceae bacterium]